MNKSHKKQAVPQGQCHSVKKSWLSQRCGSQFFVTIMDVLLQGKRAANEQSSLCKMVDRSALKDVLLIADRGYEGYNLLAHIQEKGWKFLISVKDIHTVGGFTAGLVLPETGEFDSFGNL